MYNNQWFW